MQRKKWEIINVGLKLSMIVAAVVGIFLEIEKDGWQMLRYYTVQSNLIVGGFQGYLLVKYWKKQPWTSLDMRFKGCVTVLILLTGLVYHILLRPLAKPGEFWLLDNVLLHYVVPIGMFLDWLLADKARCYKCYDPLWWTIFPISYAISSVVIGVWTRTPIKGGKEGPFPYFFLNVDKFGYLGVIQYSLVLALGFVIVSYLLVLVKQISLKNKL